VPDREPATPTTLHGLELETDWNPDWSHTRLWTRAQCDLSRPWVVCNSSKTEQKGLGWHGGAAAGHLMKNVKVYAKHQFLMSCQKFKKIWKTFLQEWYFKKIKYFFSFHTI
jgi:hypothetical protein